MKLTGNNELFRQELIRQLYDFPGDDRYTCLFRLSEIAALTISAWCVFIYRDNQTQELKLLRRDWDTKDLSFVFGHDLYDTEKMRFVDRHKPAINISFFEKTLAVEVNDPQLHNKIILDGVEYYLMIFSKEGVSEKTWQLHEQLTGNLKALAEMINTEAGLQY